MAQGEGASLLARAFKETKNQKYYISCKKLLIICFLPVQAGGQVNTDAGLILKEYPDKAPVLNGWIFLPLVCLMFGK